MAHLNIKKVDFHEFSNILTDIRKRIPEEDFDKLLNMVHEVCESNTNAINLLDDIKYKIDKFQL